MSHLGDLFGEEFLRGTVLTYEYLCETKKPYVMKVGDWIKQIKVINVFRFLRLNKEADTLTEHKIDSAQDNPQKYVQIPKTQEKDFIEKKPTRLRQ